MQLLNVFNSQLLLINIIEYIGETRMMTAA